MRYFVEPGGAPAMAEEDALVLWRRAREEEGAPDRDRLAENFQPMIAAEAARLAADPLRPPEGASAAELAGLGNLGLLRAFCCYRPDSSVRFYEYCRRRVRETMRDEARAAGASACGGIGGAAEVARLWGELRRAFSSPVFSAGAPGIPDRRRSAYRAAAVL